MFESKYGIRYPVTYPQRTRYSERMDRLGAAGESRLSKCSGQDLNRFQTPQFGGAGGGCECAPKGGIPKGCGQTTYINVVGEKRNIDPSFPYALVMYRPRPLERFFQTKERALLEVPRCGDWQIIHLPSGEIVYEPEQ